MSDYQNDINVARSEHEQLRAKIESVEALLKETRITLQGEHGTNGMKSSLDRAHTAIHGLTLRIGELGSMIHALNVESLQGDKDVEIMVLQKLDAMQKHDSAQEKKDRQWRVTQLIGITLTLGAMVVNVALQLWA